MTVNISAAKSNPEKMYILIFSLVNNLEDSQNATANMSSPIPSITTL
jgi:hypothetical protein